LISIASSLVCVEASVSPTASNSEFVRNSGTPWIA
jgi:hypothetical protein